MSDSVLSLMFGAGTAGWLYVQLAKRNGNASPASNMRAAAIGGVVVAVVFFTLLKFVFNF